MLHRLTFLLLLLAVATGPVQAQVYVDADATGAGDGTSWTDAYTDLQSALAAANGSDEVWIAAATYMPTGGTDRRASFRITGAQDGLKLYGGFAGDESQRDQRDPQANVVTLSGDIGAPGDASDNSYHVVYLDGGQGVGDIGPSTVIDGLTIAHGRADGVIVNDNGGGLHCDGAGGRCSPTIRDVIFADNSASDSGGALVAFGFGTIGSNAQPGASSPVLTDVVFTGNTAERGGAIYTESDNDGVTDLTVTNAVFANNSANESGGAVYMNSDDGSGAMTFVNSLFDANGTDHVAYDDGVRFTRPQFINCTFTGATARAITIARFDSGQAPLDAINSIFWGNNGVVADDIAAVDVTVSIVEQDALAGSIRNQNADPQFIDPARPAGADGRYGTPDDGLRLQASSPGVDVGDNHFIPSGLTTDLRGAPRLQGDQVDLGPYEAASVIYVDLRANGHEDGTSWANAYTDLQDALAVATGGDEIWIAEGTYRPGTHRTASFRITGAQDGLEIYGGFAGGERYRTERDPVAHEVVLNGDIGVRNDNVDNNYHVLVLDGGYYADEGPITTATVIDGVSIYWGHANGSSFSMDDVGGGLLCMASGADSGCSPTLSNILFSINEATYGGGMYLWTIDGAVSRPRLSNVVFNYNLAERGGGMYNYSALGSTTEPLLVNAIFVDNVAETGAGMHNVSAGGTTRPTVVHGTFAENAADTHGGAISNVEASGVSELVLTNAIVWGNTAFLSGAAIRNDGATATLTHTLIEGGLAGSGVRNLNGGTVTDEGGNLSADPLFADVGDPRGPDDNFATADDGLRLLPGSPALDAGTNAALPADRGDLDRDADTTERLPVGLAGTARVVDNDADPGTPARVDLGAYEAAPDTQLPVELTAFTARRDGEAIRLAWTTASETNNAGFEVQRRRSGNEDADAWEPLGFVEGHGTTTEAQTYRFTDRDLPYAAPGAMYRLRQVDTDGTETLSEAVEITRAAPTELQLQAPYPNPARSRATVRFTIPEGTLRADAQLHLYDVLGREVRAVRVPMKPGRHELRLNTERLASGLYLLRLTVGDETRTHKLTVVR